MGACSNTSGTESVVDASVRDATHVDIDSCVMCPADSGAADAGLSDAALVDTGSADAGGIDASTVDGGEVDASTSDAGEADAGMLDAGVADAGFVDAGAVDAGAPDSGTSSASNGSCTWTYMSNTYCEQADSSVDEGEVRLQCSYVEGTFNYVCPSAGRIGSCRVGAAGQPGVLWYYSPMTLMAAMMSCSAQAGTWLGGP
jgi:hypothetical protein